MQELSRVGRSFKAQKQLPLWVFTETGWEEAPHGQGQGPHSARSK